MLVQLAKLYGVNIFWKVEDGGICPVARELHALMKECLSDKPEERPTAAKIVRRLSLVIKKSCPPLELPHGGR